MDMRFMLEILLKSRSAGKLYEKMFEHVREEYGMTQLEVDIVAFLKNNPGLDTASDIVKYRMLPKANVSQAVELLIRRGLVKRRPDGRDRRRVHLELTGPAEAAAEQIREAQGRFSDLLFEGFTDEERRQYQELTGRIAENIRRRTGE